MDIEEAFLSLGDVFLYLQATPESRTIVEGEQLLNSKHLILCGLKNTPQEDVVDIFSLCLQTSGILKSSPHGISGKLLVSNGNLKIDLFQCTCKAGMSEKCKHIAANLLKCTRWYKKQVT